MLLDHHLKCDVLMCWCANWTEKHGLLLLKENYKSTKQIYFMRFNFFLHLLLFTFQVSINIISLAEKKVTY